jgi:3-deoxy-7-phosphoheptulonate synthase
MIVILKPDQDKEKVEQLIQSFEKQGFKTTCSMGIETIVIGLIGDTTRLDMDAISANEIVQSVKRVSDPFKASNRKFHHHDTVIDVAGIRIGDNNITVAAGPCSVESEEQIIEVAKAVKLSGAQVLRGGAFKPRTSPYAFQGLKAEGIELLLKAKKETDLPIVTEIMNMADIDLFADVDIIQVGARNMQNFEMLKELGKCDKPILLKRGLSSTIEEFLMSAEYIMAGGNSNVILCERGIRTFETAMRNTLDLAGIAMLKKKSHLPVFMDPSHATGITWLVEPMAKAAIMAGADGVIIEVHNNPSCALCDGAQSLTPEEFDKTMKQIKRVAEFEGKTV